MSFANFLKTLKDKHAAVLSSLPVSLLLIGFEELMDLKFLCPCITEKNASLTVAVFIAPTLLIFTVMYLFLRFFKYICCCQGCETFLKCPKAFLTCLIPTVVWIILMFLDGEYYACGKTDWNGTYIFDEKLQMKWCEPTELKGGRSVSDVQHLTHQFIVESKFGGYIGLIVFSVLIFAVFGAYDCCRCEDSETQRNDQEAELMKMNN